MRGLTPEQIHGFTAQLLMSRFDNPKPTPDFHHTLWELMCNPHNKVAIAAPRGHAKSTAVTHSFVLACICFQIKKHVLIVSDTESQSSNFLRDIKNEFIENDALINLFGVKRLIKDTETEIIVEFKDGYQARVIAKGSEQKLRGTKWRNTRPDLVVGDDLENDEIVLNEERRAKFRQWFYNALLPCGSDNCDFRIVGTILHLDSLLERLMPQLGMESTVDDGLVQYSTNQDKAWMSLRFKAHTEDFEKILWPEKFSKERLTAIRQDYVDQGFPEGYAQEYLNYPIDESTAYFQKRDFLPIGEEAGPEEYYVAADLAISEKKSRAFTVLAVASVTPSGKLRVRDIVRFRGDSLQIIDELFALQSRYKPEMFFIEQENIARALGPVLNKEMEERGVFLSIEKMQATQDKIKRARGLQARMRAGAVEFDTEAEWFPQLQQEMLQFPRGAYMDQVDSLAWIALGLDQIVEAPTQAELDDEEYYMDMEETTDFGSMGANSWTGY